MNDDLVTIPRMHFNDLAWAAVRYALGRKTYMVATVCDVLIKNADKLYNQNREKMTHEILRAIETGSAGMPVDVKDWQRVLDAFEKINNE
jgi:hypothetical protein